MEMPSPASTNNLSEPLRHEIGIPRLPILPVGISLVLLAWRLSWYPRSSLYRDWVAILSVYWILAVVLRGSRERTLLTAIAMVGLFLIYAAGYLPQLLDHLRLTFL